jgi:hypothetical protein
MVGTGITTLLGTDDGTQLLGTKTAVVEEITKTQTPVGAYEPGIITPVVG